MWWFETTVLSYKGFNMSQLNIDEAWLNISSMFGIPVWLYVLSNNCQECPFQKFLEYPILSNFSYKSIINVQHGTTFRFRTQGNSTHVSVSDDQFKVCDLPVKMGEFGVYSIFVESESSSVGPDAHCVLKCDLEPVDIYLPIFGTMFFWIIMGLTFSSVAKNKTFLIAGLKLSLGRIPFVRRSLLVGRMSSENHESDSQSLNTSSVASASNTEAEQCNRTIGENESNNSEVAPLVESPTGSESVQSVRKDSLKERLKSLDAFRGLCILIMIFVDDGGGNYYFFRHCTWDGLYVADLAFPWFIWICGVCIPLSLHSKKSSGSAKLPIFFVVLKRSIKLTLLGLMVNTSTRATAVPLETLRFPGVLQRFGICYFVGASLFLWVSGECNSSDTAQNRPHNQATVNLRRLERWKVFFGDIATISFPWMLVIACATLHTVLIFTLHVPDCPTGYLGPGGLHRNNSIPKQCVGGATGYVDRLVFGQHHIHNRPTSKAVYDSGPFDPEGLLGVLTSVLHIWLGVQAGLILLTYRSSSARVYRFLAWSVFCGIVGLLLCGGFKNEGWIPVNKNLWSLSFVLVTSSAALMLLTVLYLVIDVFKLWSGSPLMETGMNSILLYLGHEVCHAMLPWHYSYGRMQTHISRLFESSCGTVLWIIIAIYLHKQKLFFVV